MKPQNLTILRSLDLLTETETGDVVWKVQTLRNAVKAHLRALVAKPQRRKAKR